MWVRTLFIEGLFEVELASSKGLERVGSFLGLLRSSSFFPTRFLLVPRQRASSLPKDTFSLHSPLLLTKDPALAIYLAANKTPNDIPYAIFETQLQKQ
jgi:hypothetical protein